MDLFNHKRLKAAHAKIAELRASNAELRAQLDQRVQLEAAQQYAHALAAALAQRDFLIATNVVVPPEVAAAHGLLVTH